MEILSGVFFLLCTVLCVVNLNLTVKEFSRGYSSAPMNLLATVMCAFAAIASLARLIK
jgi:hypothetical protein